MPLHNRRTIVKEEPPTFRVECRGHHDAILFVTFTIQRNDGERLTYEFPLSLKGAVIVKQEWVDLDPQEEVEG